jgi:PAS domain S-box-containing protein
VTRLSDNTFVDVNERFCDLTGFTREELIGQTGVSVGLWPEPEQRARIEAVIRGGGKVRDVEVRLSKKSGDPIDVRMSLETFTVGGIECVFALSHDITEEKRLEEQLRQSQKMEAIGRLAGGIAHDFNNLLTAINGYSEILASDLQPGSAAHDAAAHINHSARRASSLTEQLLLFTRRQPQRGRVVEINDVVHSMSAMLARLIGEDVELVLELGCYVGCVRVDPAQIEQVLLNLVVNARDAMPDGGRLVLETVAATGTDARPGVRLTVRDSGCGIAPEIRAHIFEPFFTTKQVGKGTGLGLSIVYGVITQAGGSISVESAPGNGAAFHIWLPRVDEPAEAMAAATAYEARQQRGGETVLIVEDDEDVRDFVEFVLRQAGYRVLAAADPTGGLQFAEAHAGEIHLLLSDIVMPEMSGNEMAARAQALRPAMKVLHMSGYPGGRQRHGGFAPSGAFLQKPFSVETLTQAVRTMLDG